MFWTKSTFLLVKRTGNHFLAANKILLSSKTIFCHQQKNNLYGQMDGTLKKLLAAALTLCSSSQYHVVVFVLVLVLVVVVPKLLSKFEIFGFLRVL